MTAPKSNTRLAIILAVVAIAMLAVAYSFVPLYRLFCQAFGIPVPKVMVGQGGATIPADAPVTDRTVLIRFTANVGAGVPLTFSPREFSRKVKIGESVLTAYDAKNLSPKALNGVAVHMLYAMGGEGEQDVTPYVELQQCFCFEMQHYPGNEDVTLPLSFRLSPELPAAVHTITFSYTLFEALPNDPRIREHPDKPVT